MNKLLLGLLSSIFLFFGCASNQILPDPKGSDVSLAYGGILLDDPMFDVVSIGIRPVLQKFGLQKSLKIIDGELFVSKNLEPGRYYIETMTLQAVKTLKKEMFQVNVETFTKKTGWIFEVKENEITKIGSFFGKIKYKKSLMSVYGVSITLSEEDENADLIILNKFIEKSQNTFWNEKFISYRNKYHKLVTNSI